MDHRAGYWFTKSRSPSSTSTMAITTVTATSSSQEAIPACGVALSLCTTTHDRLLHAVIALSVIVGVLSTLALILMLLLCFRLRKGREGVVPAEEGVPCNTAAAASGGESLVFDAGNVAKGQEGDMVVLPSSSLEVGRPSAEEEESQQVEVEGEAEEDRAPHEPGPSRDVLVHAFSDDGRPPQLFECVHHPGSRCSQRHPSPAPSIAAISLDDFDQGQDREFHPEVPALVEEGKFTKEAVRDLKPVVPKEDTVLPNYNPILDEVRPKTMNEYLRNYRIFFIIDDSSSMEDHWYETRDALSEIADHALKYHSDAVDIRFFNSQRRYSKVQGMQQIMGIFDSVLPYGGTPTGQVLKDVFDEQLDRLDRAQMGGTYSSECPLDIIVLTDGVPNHDSPPAPVIEEAARRLNNTGHHQNWISIQFVQIGDDAAAVPTLTALIDCANNNHMVDTISYSFYKDEGGGKLTSKILERIILGGLHPNLRSYYNQFRRKLNQKASQAIY